jgi:hypothetical protein
MLAGAGLARCWSHDRAHFFFARARWTADDLGLAAAKLVVALLVPAGQPMVVAIDDTLFRRRGKKVRAAGWFHDGSAPGPAKTGYGNNWVIAAIIVRLPMVKRPVAVPVLAKLVIKGTTSASRLRLARRMAQMLAGALPGRRIHVVADAVCAGKELTGLPPSITWTTRLRKDAALSELPPGPHRQARAAARQGRPAAVSAGAGRHRRVRAAHRHPEREDRHHPGGRHYLPAARRLRLPAGAGDLDPRRPGHRARPGPSHHGHRCRPRPGHRALRRQMQHRGRYRGPPADLRRRPGPQPRRPRGRAHRPFPARLPGHRHHLVRHSRARPRRR